jgi:CheY-like chemotaxis protein
MTKILIVDDSSFSRKIIDKICVKNGYETEHAVNGIDCIEKYPEYKPDCILLDLLMPKMNGQGVLKHIRLTDKTLPIIVLSADIQSTTRDECIAAGASLFIQKPQKEDKFIPAILSVLNQSKWAL